MPAMAVRNQTTDDGNAITLQAGLMTEDKFNGVRGRLLFAESMAAHTSWRAGGCADVYFEPEDLDDLRYFLQTTTADRPLLWTGLGSNLLVRDGGFHGVVIAYSRALRELDIGRDGRVSTAAGVSCAKVAKLTAREGLSGAEFLAGIPGCMGGALAMNAGAFGSETWNIVSTVTTIDRAGQLATRPAGDFAVSYRQVRLPAGTWFVAAELCLQPDPDHKAAALIRQRLEQRAASQPIGQYSCGSVFRNPPGDYAARLIEACGLKGLQQGGASISARHANFIINHGSASAADIEQLLQTAQAAVLDKFAVELVPEVKIVGEPAGQISNDDRNDKSL